MNNYKHSIIGVNAYGLRYLLANGVMKTIASIKDCGLDAIEPMVIVDDSLNSNDKYPNVVWDRKYLYEVIKESSKLDIVIPSIHCLYNQTTDPLVIGKKINEIYENTGISSFVFADYTLKTIEQCEKLTNTLNQIMSVVRKEVMILYHPHENEFVCFDNKYLLDILLEKCPTLMIQADMGWIYFAKVEPLTYMYTIKNRVRMLHFKDLIPDFGPANRKNSFTAVGKGVVGYKEILQHINDFPLNEYCLTICQDNSNEDLLEDLRYGAAFIREQL